MSAFERDDETINSRDLSFSSLAENASQIFILSGARTNASSVSDHKVVEASPAEHEILNYTARSQSEVEKCENLCGSEKIETTNAVNEYNAPPVSLNCDQMIDLNHENLSYFNSRMSDCDVSIYHDFDYNETVQEDDSKDSEKMIQEEFLTNDQRTSSLSNLTELLESFVSIDSEHEKIYQTGCGGEKLVDSGISLTSGFNVEDDNKTMRQAVDNNDNSQDISEKGDVVTCKTVEEGIKKVKEMKLAQNVACINIEGSLREKLDKKNISLSTIEPDNYFMSNESYFKDDLELLKRIEENARHTSRADDDDIEETITEIKKMDKIIKNLCTSDDEHYDSAEERMIEGLTAKMENDHDDVMTKIIESCPHVPANFQQYSPIPSTDLIRSTSECVIKKFRENELFPCRRVVSETAIAKEDILRTIEEAEKILTDGPCWDVSATKNAIQITENCDKNTLSEKSTEKVRDDKEKDERVNETVNKKGIDFTENKDTKINSTNTINEKIAISESDIVESNLQKLAEITWPDRPRSCIEIQETLKKMAEEKKKIEERKKESLETLSKKLEEIDKLIADHNYAFCVSDNNSCEHKTLEDVTGDSDSLDEFQVQIDPESFEVPLTKFEITENLKVEELEKELANEMEEHKKLMDEYQEIIATDLEKIQLTLEKSEPIQACDDANVDEEAKNESKNESKNDEKIGEEFSNETFETAIEVDSDFDDSFTEELKEPEKTYVKGKIYDFDEKKHGVRMTEELIRKHCKEHKLYQTPYLNDVLYLHYKGMHYKGFTFIESLEKYTGLKCLWLESNGIREIANLENQSELKCLYLHHNLISRIENLDCLTKLDTLNLSHNTIRRIENLGDSSREADSLKFLNNLNLSHNYLRETADIEHLRLLHALSILDISHNRIDTCDVVDILGDMKSLRVVTLTGNPVLKQIKMYRKTMILKCKNLQYLDDRPVFPRDRACAEAWMRGGVDEEVAERNRWIQAEQKKINDSVMGELKDSLLEAGSKWPPLFLFTPFTCSVPRMSVFVYLSNIAPALESPDKQKEAAQTGRGVRKGGDG
ncbi:PREDICTED: interaptin [Vollenhovia emeryi]|uniref:interaptin n=1 Tax=Vollenhovia emeryi TaxID=411798 RepID=UPI0005F49B75|nr:PREDICTED: interaptin [Vollenhovia emeryi]